MRLGKVEIFYTFVNPKVEAGKLPIEVELIKNFLEWQRSYANPVIEPVLQDIGDHVRQTKGFTIPYIILYNQKIYGFHGLIDYWNEHGLWLC